MNIEPLRNKAEQYIRLWNLEPDGGPFNSNWALLWPVTRGSEKFMLKIQSETGREAQGVRALQLFDGYGAVRIFENENDVQLLERIVIPDNKPTLMQMIVDGDDDIATNILCGTAIQLHEYAKTINRTEYASFEKGNGGGPAESDIYKGGIASEDTPMFERGLELAESIKQADGSKRILIHGDLWCGNILYSDNRGWLAIDPQPKIALPAQEYAMWLGYVADGIPSEIIVNKNRIERQNKIISERTGIAQKDILQFAWLKALGLGAWASPGPWKEQQIELAKIIDDLLHKE
ncbi:MAG: aminoglycoside phosphotransferase family protein [Alphaproteobacteria bacterium]|nr:aminoglycoside phosphotransferase family protein [Alphaproteobacteria bacterium]